MKFFGCIRRSLDSVVKKCSKLTSRRQEEKPPRVKEVNIRFMTFSYIVTLLQSKWQKALLQIFGSTKGSLRHWKLKASEIKKLFFFRSSEKEKNELQSVLERELAKRSGQWSLEIKKYQAEEHRLRESRRELAEMCVSLRIEVSSCSEREKGIWSRVTHSEQQVEELTTEMEKVRQENENLKKNLSELQEKYKASEEDLTTKVEKVMEKVMEKVRQENENLKKNLSELQEKYKASEEYRDHLQRNYEEKEKECKDLHRSIAGLQRTCSEQEKSIDGLREEILKNNSIEETDNQLGKQRIEQLRPTGLELALRKEVESCRIEVDSLRHENMNLLHRLENTVKEGEFLTFKLDQELWNCICCLQNQGLSFLVDSAQLCRKLLEYIKTNESHTAKAGLGVEDMDVGIVECEVKLQGFNRGIETLTKSLHAVSAVLHEKSTLIHEKSQPVSVESNCPILGVESCHSNQKSEDMIRSELRAEILLTALLREKLCYKELEIEQLKAKSEASSRENDILKFEVQNALDSLWSLTHKIKDLELQMIKKDDNINQLQNELQDCKKELTIVRGILPKVSEERDMMREEVKQYSEKTMLLNREINTLKKEIEVLDEDVLLKDGQIAILKDAVGKPFYLLH